MFDSLAIEARDTGMTVVNVISNQYIRDKLNLIVAADPSDKITISSSDEILVKTVNGFSDRPSHNESRRRSYPLTVKHVWKDIPTKSWSVSINNSILGIIIVIHPAVDNTILLSEFFEKRQLPLQFLWIPLVVVVKESNVLTDGHFYTGIPSCRRPLGFLMTGIPNTIVIGRFNHLSCLAGRRTVINHNTL